MAAKKSSRCETMIPEDLVIEILVWLPVASLRRFKSVCKSWRSLIESSQFVSRHLQLSNSKSDSENKLVVLNSRFGQNYSFTANFISVNNLQPSKYLEFVLPRDDDHEKSCGEIIASFNSIICIKYITQDLPRRNSSAHVVSLWNPATKELRTLPPPRYETKEFKQHLQIQYGFGVDVKTNDYKVVRVIIEYHLDNELTSHVEVYSLSSDSWRIIDYVLPPYVCDMTCNPRKPFENENYCWMGQCTRISQHGYYSILCFNFSSEAFRIIPVPEIYANGSKPTLYLTFSRGEIACIDWAYNGRRPVVNNPQYAIWVLDEFGVKESWTKLYIVTLGAEWAFMDMVLMEFSTDGKILLSTNLGKLCMYDPGSEEIKDVPTRGGYIDSPAEYKASLVSVKRANGATTDQEVV